MGTIQGSSHGSEGFRAFVPGYLLSQHGETELSTRSWAPPVDIYETEDAIVLKAELPGVDPKDVEVRVEDNTLYLKGERKFEKEVKEQNYHRVERSYGIFCSKLLAPQLDQRRQGEGRVQGWHADLDDAQARRGEAEDHQDRRYQELRWPRPRCAVCSMITGNLHRPEL